MRPLEEYINDPSKLHELSPEELYQLIKVYSRWRQQNRSGLPQSAVDAMTAVVDDRLMADIVADSRRTNTPGFLKQENAAPVKRGSGWQDAIPLSGSVPGTKIIDEIAESFAAIDRRDREKQFKG
jgi:hypothetical protein